MEYRVSTSSSFTHKVIALIPARGGSKGILKKNIFPVKGKPLIDYTVEAVLNIKNIECVYISSDCDEILSHCKNTFQVNCLKRKNHLASDLATTDSVIENFIINDLKESNKNISILLLQPTSPLRTATHIKECLSIYETNKPDLLMSVYSPLLNPFKSYIMQDDTYIRPLINPDAPFSPRQLLPKVYYPNGAIYLFSVEKFMENRRIPRDKVFPYEMTREDSIDIDTLADIKEVERILNDREE